jgi:hypothetical protein
MLLADFAQVSEGKLNIIGGGWSVTGPGPCNGAVAIQIKIPWDQTNRRHKFELTLLDGDSNPILLQPNPEAEGQPLQIAGEFEVGRPPGVLAGSSIEHHVAFNFVELPLPPGRRLMWELRINGRAEEDWRLPFTTRQAPPAQLAS